MLSGLRCSLTGHCHSTARARVTHGGRYLHAAGIIHRDLKPSNMCAHAAAASLSALPCILKPADRLVGEDCDVNICDFGQARLERDHLLTCNQLHCHPLVPAARGSAVQTAVQHGGGYLERGLHICRADHAIFAAAARAVSRAVLQGPNGQDHSGERKILRERFICWSAATPVHARRSLSADAWSSFGGGLERGV